MGGRMPVCSVYIGVYIGIYIGIYNGQRKEACVQCALIYIYISIIYIRETPASA